MITTHGMYTDYDAEKIFEHCRKLAAGFTVLDNFIKIIIAELSDPAREGQKVNSRIKGRLDTRAEGAYTVYYHSGDRSVHVSSWNADQTEHTRPGLDAHYLYRNTGYNSICLPATYGDIHGLCEANRLYRRENGNPIDHPSIFDDHAEQHRAVALTTIKRKIQERKKLLNEIEKYNNSLGVVSYMLSGTEFLKRG